jgi:hypothetical protein
VTVAFIKLIDFIKIIGQKEEETQSTKPGQSCGMQGVSPSISIDSIYTYI